MITDDDLPEEWNQLKNELQNPRYETISQTGVEELTRREQWLVKEAVVATWSLATSKQGFSAIHNDPPPNGRSDCLGDIYAFINNNGDVKYQCQSCSKKWRNVSL
jgi:hypothetical protein